MALFEGEQYSEYGHLIENGNPLTPQYLSINTSGNCHFWSSDAYDALRFSRKIDAEQFLAVLAWPLYRAVEHCFVYNEKETDE